MTYKPGTPSGVRLDAGAKALRKFEMEGRCYVEWEDVTNSQKRKWWAKASVVLEAADLALKTAAYREEPK